MKGNRSKWKLAQSGETTGYLVPGPPGRLRVSVILSWHSWHSRTPAKGIFGHLSLPLYQLHKPFNKAGDSSPLLFSVSQTVSTAMVKPTPDQVALWHEVSLLPSVSPSPCKADIFCYPIQFSLQVFLSNLDAQGIRLNNQSSRQGFPTHCDAQGIRLNNQSSR